MPLAPFPNLARQAAIRKQVADDLIPHMKSIRADRQALNGQLARYWRIWLGRRDASAGFHGRNQAYVMTGKRIIENWIQKVKADLFPRSGRWLAVEGEGKTGKKREASIEGMMHEFVQQQMKMRQAAAPWLRSLVTLGTKPGDWGWKTEEIPMPVLRDLLTDDGRLTGRQEETVQRILHYIGPTYRPIDLFLWYVHPTTANSPGEASLVFEDMLMPLREIERFGKLGIGEDRKLGMYFEQTKELLQEHRPGYRTKSTGGGGTETDKFAEENARLAARGLPGRTNADAAPLDTPLDIVKAWWKTAPLTDEDAEATNGEDCWYQVFIGGETHVLQVRRNPWWTVIPPSTWARFMAVEHEAYGYGLAHTFDSLQYRLNDTFNQSGDASDFTLNPIVAVDPMMVQDPTSTRVKPGAKWLVRNPRDAIHMLEPPKDTPIVGMNLVSQYIALMNDVANVAPFAGVGAGGPRSRGRALGTAAGMQIIASEAMVQVQDVIEQIEDDHLNPGLRIIWKMAQQHLDREMIVTLRGVDGAGLVKQVVTRRDLSGDYTFRWLSSTSAHNQQVLAQQMLTGIQVFSRIPPQILQAQGVEVDWALVLRRLWSDGFGLTDARKVIRPLMDQESIDPIIENDLFRVGKGDEVEVSIHDDDPAHIKSHEAMAADPTLDPLLRGGLLNHLRRHLASMIAKQKMAQQQQALQLMQGMGMAVGGSGGPGAPAPGLPGAGPDGTSGRTVMPEAPGRLAATTSPSDVMRRMPRPGGSSA